MRGPGARSFRPGALGRRVRGWSAKSERRDLEPGAARGRGCGLLPGDRGGARGDGVCDLKIGGALLTLAGLALAHRATRPRRVGTDLLLPSSAIDRA